MDLKKEAKKELKDEEQGDTMLSAENIMAVLNVFACALLIIINLLGYGNIKATIIWLFIMYTKDKIVEILKELKDG